MKILKWKYNSNIVFSYIVLSYKCNSNHRKIYFLYFTILMKDIYVSIYITFTKATFSCSKQPLGTAQGTSLAGFSRIYASLSRRESDIPGFSRAPLDRDESLSAYESSLRFYEHTVNYKLHFLAADNLKAVWLVEIWSERRARCSRKRKRSNYSVGRTPQASHFAPCTVSLFFFCSLSLNLALLSPLLLSYHL